jgi:flagellar FliL protein
MVKKGLTVWFMSALLVGCFKKESLDQRSLNRALFIPVPSVVVNLMQTGNNRSYLKLSLVLEVRELASAKKIEEMMPVITDRLQMFLRTLRMADLEGTTGMPRLKAYLKAEINLVIKPYEVSDVLFKEVIVQ